jgi:hypothetical protein
MIYSLSVLALFGVLSVGQVTPPGTAYFLLCYDLFTPNFVVWIPLISKSVCLTSPFAVIAPISLADFQNITLYSQYAAAAYCDANNNVRVNPNPQLNCSGAIQPAQQEDSMQATVPWWRQAGQAPFSSLDCKPHQQTNPR